MRLAPLVAVTLLGSGIAAAAEILDPVLLLRNSPLLDPTNTAFGDPASFSASGAADSDNTYLIDGGIGAGIEWKPGTARRYKTYLSAELHRNNAIDAEQDKRFYALNQSALFGEVEKEGWALIPSLAAGVADDRVAGNRSMVATLTFVPLFRDIPVGHAIDHLGPSVRLWLAGDVAVGGEYEHIYKSKGDFESDSVGRVFGRASLQWKPFFNLAIPHFPPIEPLMLVPAIKVFDDVYRSGDAYEANDRFDYEASIALKYVVGDHYTFSGSYLNGGNPITGKEHQKYWKVSLDVFF